MLWREGEIFRSRNANRNGEAAVGRVFDRDGASMRLNDLMRLEKPVGRNLLT